MLLLLNFTSTGQSQHSRWYSLVFDFPSFLYVCILFTFLQHVSVVVCFGFTYVFLKLRHISPNGYVLGHCSVSALVGHRT